jgi:hypothetical protein
MFDDKSVLSARDAALTAGGSAIAPDSYGLDFDGDRHSDMLWHNTVSGENALWYLKAEGEGDSGATYRASVTIDSMSGEWHIKSAIDFNLDGHQDLLWRNALTGQNEVWWMGGANGNERQGKDAIAPIDRAWDVVGAADFNQDGRGDLLWRNSGTGQNEVWLMGGDKGIDVLSKESVKAVGNSWEIRGVADFNKDNHADILWRHQATGKNVVWFMGGEKGSDVQSSETLKTVGDGWQIHGAADFNQDASPDIFWRHEGTGKNVVWHMTGANGTQIKSDVVLPAISSSILPAAQGAWLPIVSGWAQGSAIATPPSQTPVDPQPVKAPEKNGFNIRFDYRFDTSKWFDSQKRAVLEAAAGIWSKIIQDEFENIKAGTTIHASSVTKEGFEAFTLDSEIDDLLVFAYANNMGGVGGQLAEAGATVYQGDRNTSSVFRPWLGEIEFDLTEPWYVNANIDAAVNVPGTEADMLSVAVHELGHILGISSSIAAFKSKINSRGEFTGEKATAINGGKPIPLDSKNSHIRDGFEVPGLGENSLDPQLAKGTRKLLTVLDVAMLDDIGYTVDTSSLKQLPKVTVLSLMRGNSEVTQVQAGDTLTLRWQDNFSAAVKIDLYEGSRYVRTIDSATDSDGSYTWKAPDELANPNTYYRLKISSVENNTIYSYSDRPFTIQPIQPKSFISSSRLNDSTLKIGNQYDVFWNDNLSETIKIELYKSGSYSRTLTASTMSDGSYRFTVPAGLASGSDYTLKLTSTADASLYNYSPTFRVYS